MKLKASKYNVAIEHDGNILLYNSIFGIDSICKININEYSELYDVLLNNGEIQYHDIYKNLLSKNILVDANYNEDLYRKLHETSSLFDSGTNLIIMPIAAYLPMTRISLTVTAFKRITIPVILPTMKSGSL